MKRLKEWIWNWISKTVSTTIEWKGSLDDWMPPKGQELIRKKMNDDGGGRSYSLGINKTGHVEFSAQGFGESFKVISSTPLHADDGTVHTIRVKSWRNSIDDPRQIKIDVLADLLPDSEFVTLGTTFDLGENASKLVEKAFTANTIRARMYESIGSWVIRTIFDYRPVLTKIKSVSFTRKK